MSTLIVIFMVVVIVIVHELAHAVTVKLMGFKVQSIALGIPIDDEIWFGHKISTVLWRKELKNGVKLYFSWLLLGGGVGYDKEFKVAPFWKQTAVFMAGPLSNLLLALIACVVWLGPTRGLDIFGQIFAATVEALWLLFTGKVPFSDLLSVVGMVAMAARRMEEVGWLRTIKLWWVLVNIGLALTNILPIPALDGGRVLVAAAMSWWGEKAEKPARYSILVSMYILIVLILLLVGKDVWQLLSGHVF